MFESWDRLAGTMASSLFFFVLIVVLSRVMGKRLTANMNNFDWILAVTIGSLAASGILLKNVSIADAVGAVAVISAAQWLTTWAAARWDWFADVVKPRPRLLTHKGTYLDDALTTERITRAEVDAALRKKGYFECAEANWVIVETNGELSVMPRREREIDDVELLHEVRTRV